MNTLSYKLVSDHLAFKTILQKAKQAELKRDKTDTNTQTAC